MRELFLREKEQCARSQLREFLRADKEYYVTAALASGHDGNYEKHCLSLFSFILCYVIGENDHQNGSFWS